MERQTISAELIDSEEEQNKALKQTLFFKTTKWLSVVFFIFQVILIVFSFLRNTYRIVTWIPALMIFFVLSVIRSVYIYDKTKEKKKLIDVILYFILWCITSFNALVRL